ncbi:MAG: SMP-30/gluconolactonase/LRE family protein [Proteobacteria bacterium]|nr:SMP-30/gluconolactonase/LRE family protein [Pseudomonadota bacterium]
MRNDKGFILITLLFMLLLLSVTAFMLNSRSGLQSRMAYNQTQAVQTHLGQVSVLEKTIWKLNQSPGWRTLNESFPYNGTAYTGTVLDSSGVAGYSDAVTISVKAPGGAGPLKESFRYYMDTLPPFINKKPYRLRADAAGTLYFADTDSNSIWRINAASGAIIRVVGNDNSGFSGDGGQAILAQLNGPQGLCISSTGEMYIADTRNHRIRKVSFGGISTYAGNGTNGYGGDGGSALNAALSNPKSCAVDSTGNLYIADSGNCMIRKIDATTKIITLVAGRVGEDGHPDCGFSEGLATKAKLNNPSDLYKTSSGDIYVADTENNRIRKFKEGGNMSTVAGSAGSGYSGDYGPATAALLNGSAGIFVDSANNIYIADTGNHCIRKVSAETGTITTVAGTGWAGYYGDGLFAWWARLDSPAGVYVNSTGDMIISDTMNSTLRKVAASTGIISTMAITASSGLNAPRGMVTYYDRNEGKMYLYIVDMKNHRVRKLDILTNKLTTVAGTGTAGFSGDGGAATGATLDTPGGIAVDSSGNLFIADTNNSRIRKVDFLTGIIITVAGKNISGYDQDEHAATSAKLNKPSDVFVDASGTFFIADTQNHLIRKVDTSGTIHTVAGTARIAGYSGDGGSATSAQISSPGGVFVDVSGNVYFADTGNNSVRKVNTSAIISTVAGTGLAGYLGDGGAATSATLTSPTDVRVDGSGSLFIADSGNHAVRVVTGYDGKIKTFAGVFPKSSGFNGDNQPAVAAKMNGPSGVVLSGTNGNGKIYISDTVNNKIRVLMLRKVKELY